MKRFLLSILMVVIGLSAFSQSLSKLISLRPAYPLVIGESAVDGIELSSNGLNVEDVYLDSLPQYEIGQIFEQTVRYSLDGYGFYVKADSLKSLNVSYSYEVHNPPQGSIEFNETTGRFKYYPAIDDYKMFTVTFTATNGTESVSEEVEFNLMPKTPSEEDAFSTQGTMPDKGDYTIVAETSKSMYFNNENRTAYSISISGKDVIFDDAVQNKVWGLNNREDIYELNIYAERLIIRSMLSFPGANITVYAKELIFEDKGNNIASINTTPPSDITLTDGEGADGACAGNITLYVKEFQANMGIRLIANGAKGQSTNRNGTPGKGGNGGVITSTIDVGFFCDFVRGSGGVRYNVAADGSTNAGPVDGYGKIGDSGRLMLVERPYAYLHPYYISAVMRQANDAFINNRTEYTLQVCREYRTMIDDYLNSMMVNEEGGHEGAIDNPDNLLGIRRKSQVNDVNYLIYDDTEERLGLQNNLIEINKMLFKLEQGLDYFGNPVGWVPLLSFEVMLANYNDEIDRAIPTLYMYYWLSRVDRTLQDMVQASQFAASTTEQEISANQELLNSLVFEIPVLQDEAEEVAHQIEELTQRIDQLQRQLMAQATKNVKKRNRWKKLFGIASTVASVIPAVGPVATVVNVASNVIDAVGKVSNLFGQNNDYISSTSAVLNSVGSIDLNSIIGDVQSTIQSVQLKNIGKDKDYLKNTYERIESTIKPLTSKIADLTNLLSKSSAPNSEIQAEYNKLIANSALYKELVSQAEELNRKKEELIAHLNQVFSDMTTTVSDISNDILALDALRRDVFTGNSKRDLNAMIYLEKMEQRAKDRLLLYDYYLRKAYEYRLLKPYEGEFNLVGMFERFENLGQTLGDVVDEAAYNSLKSIFRDRISDMTQEIITGYTSNYPEQSAPITLVIPKDQLNTINAEEGLTLNFHDMGIFASDEENVRIVSLEIEHIKTHVEGSIGASGYMDLNLTHSGISTFRKDGYLYWFNHRSRSTTSPHTWGMRYDAVSNKTTTIQPSAASTSLIRSIINTGDVMLFSRPSAWSDLTLTKKVHSSGGADVVIDSLVIKLQYDFTRHPDNIRNIDITASDGLLPYIACSKDDISGRSGGYGHLYRSYTQSSQTVTFTAVDKYESFYFKNWTDRVGNIVSSQPTLEVNRQKDQFYIANYEYRGPLLSVPDTIYVRNEGGSYTVDVRNVGLSDEEMDWYVTDSLSTWTHIEGTKEGIDDGSFTFTIEANTTGKERVDYVEILAPESYVTLKKIYIIQTDEIIYNNVNVTDISKLDNAVYINPIIASKGSKVRANIQLKNADAATAYVFDIVLPDGVTIAKNDKGKYLDELSDRHEDHTRTMNYKGNNTYSFSTLSGNSEALTGNDGVIRIVTLQVDDNIAENAYAIEIKNASYSKPDGTFVSLPNTKTSIKVINYIIGDVNGNGIVDIGDAVSIVNYLVGKESQNFVEKAADTNYNGLVDIGDAVTIVNFLVGKTENLSRLVKVWNEKEPQ